MEAEERFKRFIQGSAVFTREIAKQIVAVKMSVEAALGKGKALISSVHSEKIEGNLEKLSQLAGEFQEDQKKRGKQLLQDLSALKAEKAKAEEAKAQGAKAEEAKAEKAGSTNYKDRSARIEVRQRQIERLEQLATDAGESSTATHDACAKIEAALTEALNCLAQEMGEMKPGSK